ncbi:MAG: hypothetical protein A3G18_10740 [Rhodospirillales bacterium RIFCSPLOWO2_12_FULL_58_28]|nr:MAG: hypothetical protein A3H92_11095 [Rhodospirillales bacterium RIFCSPLOWO2_02_FULL_58_16]OHC77896.1 MAG: hypothetical protein A3G18_10740 [Rhodospirillales bacterium RIFCSPLOWO2_12_FULL_58_28]
MNIVVESVRELFGFHRYEFIIANLGIIFLLSNFCGGLLYSIILAQGKPRKEVPLKERISFRLLLLGWGFVLVFAVYFHAVLFGKITMSHFIFWAITLVSAPALAYFGSQLTYVIFQKKIEHNRAAYKAGVDKIRAAKAAQMTAATKAAADDKAAAERKKKMDAEIDAKIAKSRKEHKVGQI